MFVESVEDFSVRKVLFWKESSLHNRDRKRQIEDKTGDDQRIVAKVEVVWEESLVVVFFSVEQLSLS
jgi:hypothetical protein